MKKYLTKERVLFIVGLLILILGLTSCGGNNDKYTRPLNNYGEESGLFGYILVWPIAWIMHTIGSLFPSATFVWGLLFTTLIIRTIAWPIYAKTNDMSMKMALAQPEMTKIQAKYANRQDPQSKQRMQQEMMAVYKKYKISLLGCFAPLLQMPIFIAMYQVVRRITIGFNADGTAAKLALTDTSFFGIANCLEKGVMATDTINKATGSSLVVGLILAAIVGVSMWFLNYFAQKKPSYQKQTYTHNQNPQQNQMASTMKVMNYVMIIMMVFAALSSNGLALYWVFGNIYSIIQGFINRYLNEKKYYKMKQANTINNLI